MSIYKDMKEIKVEEYLVKRAKVAGGSAKKLKEDERKGFSDRTIFLPYGWVAFAEVKRPVGGVVSEHQKEHRKELRRLNVRHYIVSNFSEVDGIFDDYATWLGHQLDGASPTSPIYEYSTVLGAFIRRDLGKV